MKLVFLALMLPLPAFAGSFIPPEGCTANLTVQSRGCNVANFYTCEADTAGDQWRADYDQQGLYYLSRIDSETQWVESREMNPNAVQTLDPNPKDAANFTELLATGKDSFEFGLTKDTGEHTNVTGFDKLTGKSVEISGVTLLETEYEMLEVDDAGTTLRQARGHEYVSEKYRTFFSGTSEYLQGEEWLPLEGSPVQFSTPGDKGFGVTQPIFDCDAVLSGLPAGGDDAT